MKSYPNVFIFSELLITFLSNFFVLFLIKLFIFSDLEVKTCNNPATARINLGRKSNELSDTFSSFFEKNINLAHIKPISLFLAALCKTKTVCFSILSTVFDSPAKFSSCLWRIQRFSAEFNLGLDIVTEFFIGGRNEYYIPIFDF